MPPDLRDGRVFGGSATAASVSAVTGSSSWIMPGSASAPTSSSIPTRSSGAAVARPFVVGERREAALGLKVAAPALSAVGEVAPAPALNCQQKVLGVLPSYIAILRGDQDQA